MHPFEKLQRRLRMVNGTLLNGITIQYDIQYDISPNYSRVAAQAYLCEVRVDCDIVHDLDVPENPSVFDGPQSTAGLTPQTELTSTAKRSPGPILSPFL